MKIIVNKQSPFYKRYVEFTSQEQDVLKVLSIVYDSVQVYEVLQCIQRAGLKTPLGAVYTRNELQRILNFLNAQGIITLQNYDEVLVNSLFVEEITCLAIYDGSYSQLSRAVENEFPIPYSSGYGYYFRGENIALRLVRLALYGRKSHEEVVDVLNKAIDHIRKHSYENTDPAVTIFLAPLNTGLLSYLPEEMATTIFDRLFRLSIAALRPVHDLWDFFLELRSKNSELKRLTDYIFVFQKVLRGKSLDSEDYKGFEDYKTLSTTTCHGFIETLRGNCIGSSQLFEINLDFYKKVTQCKPSELFLNSFEGLFYPLAHLSVCTEESLKKAIKYLNKITKKKTSFIYPEVASDLKKLVLLYQGKKGDSVKIDHSLSKAQSGDQLARLMGSITLYWLDGQLAKEHLLFLSKMMNMAEDCGYLWFARECGALVSRCSDDKGWKDPGRSGFGYLNKEEAKQNLRRLNKKITLEFPLLIDLVKPQARWQQALESLLNFDKQSSGKSQKVKKQEKRIVWDIELCDDTYEVYLPEFDDFTELESGASDKLTITPREQKCGKNGKWSKGRNIALKTLMEKYPDLDYLTDKDRQLCQAITKKKESIGYYYHRRKKDVYSFNYKKALAALIDHPLVFSKDSPSIRMEFVRKDPELHVQKIEEGYSIYVTPDMLSEEPFLLSQETMTRISVVFMTSEFQNIINILEGGIVVPLDQKKMVLNAIAAVAPKFNVHTDVAGMAPHVKEVEADSTPYFNLVPFSDGLKGELLSKPFSEGGTFFKPGQGSKIVVTEIEGDKVQAHRDLSLEESNASSVINSCSILASRDEGDNEWLVTDPENCLELLSELKNLDDKVVIQWPKGETLKVTHQVDSSAFSMRIQKEIDWFAATGELKIDDKSVVDMKKLLEMSRNSTSRFMKMDDGTYLALTKAFKKQLDEFDSFTFDYKGGVRFDPLASLALEGFTSEIGRLTGDKHWKQNQKRFAEPPGKFKIPSTLQANLRDYQVDGFNWLATLSHWNVGACLADDMGIGKTVQALSAILLRAGQGPTLVIAPTSVLMNWNDEAVRFTPTLSVLNFGQGNRKKMLDNLQPFDLVVTSYGLLHSESEKLSKVKWQTIVLDEAQAIKNMATKRSKAAMALQAEFKIITTGTPIENHLGELWNLFQFINPGFLGSAENFNQIFATPIEKFKDNKARVRLKKLIQPFILRRLKRDVLTELPSRTEITMHVEMTKDEATLYEAQRQRSIEKIEEAQEQADGGNMQILAELTRLRRFCCNPQLVAPDCEVESSKLSAFSELIDELLDNGHKALVFSQFVGHLSILEDCLDKKGVSYQYLDGSTPVKKRQQRIREFQSGVGDIFLISLKAGGSGLNLTAADYVIHMDPWWNPAVEDQASDRAHRIGQKRPVTVYRLVVKDSIEEKIIKLHGTKRDLATNLLEGTEMAGKVSTRELLALIKG